VVTAGQPLVEVEGSAATVLAVQEARNALAAAERDLQLVQQRYDQKLATNSELFTAQNAVKSAQARLHSLEQGGAAGPHQLNVDAAGIVSKVDVQAGQIVPVGGPLVEVADRKQIAVKLGVEPTDAAHLVAGQPVELLPVDVSATNPAAGKIRLVSQRVDPASRLVEVIVSPPEDSMLQLDSFVSGRITRSWSSAEGFVVPREAALPEDDGSYSLFTVKDGRAVKHSVKIGIESGQEVQVISDDLKEGDSVVIVGNHELDDGIAVQAEPASQPSPSEPAATEPAATEPAASQPSTSQPALQTGGPR
jgi:membrane fusion protein (multidrug efflux system)